MTVLLSAFLQMNTECNKIAVSILLDVDFRQHFNNEMNACVLFFVGFLFVSILYILLSYRHVLTEYHDDIFYQVIFLSDQDSFGGR